MKALVTRPAHEALAWVADLQAHGVQAEALSLIDILPPADLAPLQAAWQGLAAYSAVMFVSGNAVEHFFASKPPEVRVEWSFNAIKNVAIPRCWATGPGTARALLAQGVPATQIDAPTASAARFDSETLWALVCGQMAGVGQRVLMVRGVDEQQSTGRPWLEDQLLAVGAQVDTVLAYCRTLPNLPAERLQRLRDAAQDGTVWLFSSSQAINHLQQLDSSVSWAQARSVATHPRIAQAARAVGFGVVCESRPALDDLVRSIKSLHD